MKRFLSAVALSCVLSVSAQAGEVHSTGAPEPTPGDIHDVGTPAPATQTSDVMTTVILAILSIVP